MAEIKTVKTIRPDQVKDFHGRIWTEADTYFTSKVKPEWDKNENLYMDAYDFVGMRSTQAKVREPWAENLVTRLSNFFSRILIKAEERYHTIRHKDTSTQKAYHDHLTAVLRDNTFPAPFNTSFQLGLLTSIYVHKVDYVYDIEKYPVFDPKTNEFNTKEEIVGRTKVMMVDPKNIRLDPFGDRYIIEIKKMDIGTFRRLAKANKWMEADKVINHKLQPSASTSPTDPQYSSDQPFITLHYVYTKFLTEPSGRVLDEDVHYIIAENQWTIHYKQNILSRGKYPYIVAQPMKYLLGRYGRGYISKLRSIILGYIEALNMTFESFLFATLGAHEVLKDSIPPDAAHLFTKGIQAGVLYPVMQPNSIRNIFKTDFSPVALQFLFFLDRRIQNDSAQNEFFQGAPTAKGRPTLGEVQIKSQETQSFFTDIAAHVETDILEPELSLILETELIYLDDEFHVDLSENIESDEAIDTLRSKSFNDRIDDFRKARVEVKSISGKLQKLANFQKRIQILNVLGNLGIPLQALMASKVIEKSFDAIDDSPDELFNIALLEQLGAVGAPPVEGGGLPGETQFNPTLAQGQPQTGGL